ncbi:Nucleotide-binding universal stress protein, UspA family [Haladaptatus litoreus]|uniref:Nucleotide-binding universal stress protein, UspA family n=1 Tax=Haladaptatus litoreus TaxID=553468 RepID=A0A1N6UPA4_9EURY|nr:universal stress protein [Haladaptatus litoreus]SIQ67387.1 Nucleotide-binding universal stress protein, UspA family [Haladaptatus litoreus]
MTASPVEVNTVLVPVDGSDESVRAIEYAVAIAEKYDARVHALYVLGEEMTRAVETGAVEEDDVVVETESFIDSARDVADDAGVELSNSIALGFSTMRKLQHPGSAVLDCADEIDADFLVIPREPLSGEPGEVLEKAAEYVLLYASQPVLSV